MISSDFLSLIAKVFRAPFPVIFSIILFADVSFAFSDSNNNCPLVAHAGEKIRGVFNSPEINLFFNAVASKDLSVLWAQEIIGADLAREFVQTLPNRKLIPVGVIDDGLNIAAIPPERVYKNLQFEGAGAARFNLRESPHGTAVTNLIVGDDGIGASASGVLNRFQSFRNAAEDVYAEIQRPGYENWKLTTSYTPKVVNLSFYHERDWCKKMGDFPAFRSWAPFFVQAAGNNFFQLKDDCWSGLDKRKFSLRIGSLSFFGVPSVFSQVYEVDLFAPSDYYIQTYTDFPKKFESFGGTSGAAPLASAAATDVFSVLDQTDNNTVYEIIMASASPTALKWLNPKAPRLLNQYRAVRLAMKANDYCAAKKDIVCWADVDLEFKKFLQELTVEAAADFEKGEILFTNPDCNDKIQGHRLMRKAFLLDPDNEKYAAKLALIYEGYSYSAQGTKYPLGLSDLARYYRSISEKDYFSNGIFKSFSLRTEADEIDKQRLYLRAQIAASNDSGRSSEILSSNLISSNPHLAVAALELSVFWLRYRGSRPLYESVVSLESKSEPRRWLRYQALLSANIERQKWIEEALNDKNEEIRALGQSWADFLKKK